MWTKMIRNSYKFNHITNNIKYNYFNYSTNYKSNVEEIKKLRMISEAPIKDCKNALEAAKGDFTIAFEWLRKKGIATATAKSNKTTAEGLIGAYSNNNIGVLIEINSETDFVARNNKFQHLVLSLTKGLYDLNSNHLNDQYNENDLNNIIIHYSDKQSKEKVSDLIPELIGKVGENISIKRGYKLTIPNGIVSSYLHNTVTPGAGRAGALVAIKYPEDKDISQVIKEKIQEIGYRLAMHVVAAKPKYLSREKIPSNIILKEKNMLQEQVKSLNKPNHIIEKMVLGRLNKFYTEVALEDQLHVVEEGNPVISKFLNKKAKEFGLKYLKLENYQRYEVGELNNEVTTET